MDKLKLGIIGLGMGFDRLHLPALRRLTELYEIVAICDENEEKREMYKESLNIEDEKVFQKFDGLLRLKEVEAVLTILPIEENFEVAREVLKSGKNLMAEKPFASTIEGAKELLELAKKKKVKVLVAENFRYHEEFNIIKSIIDEKKLGDVVYFVDNNINDFNHEKLGDTFAAKEWRQHPKFEGGVFLDGAIHHIAKLRHLFGDVESLCAYGNKLDNCDFCEFTNINSLLKFKSGVVGHYIYFNTGKETQAPLLGFRVFFTNGEIYLEEKDCGFINLTYKDGTRELITYKPEEGYFNEWKNFYNAIKNDESIVSTMEKEIGDMVLLFEIFNCAKKG